MGKTETPRPEVRVRRATARDLEQYAKNLQEVADEGRYLFTEEVKKDRLKSTERMFKDKSCLAIVAEVGSGRTRRVVGSLTMERYGNVRKTSHVRVLGMLVVKGYREMGIGTKLVAYALEWAKSQKDVEKVVLGVFSNNKRAFRLYEKFGFKVEGVKRDQYYIDGRHADEIDMALFPK